MRALRTGWLVFALVAFATLAVGATGGLLLARYRAASLEAVAGREALVVRSRAHLVGEELGNLVAEVTRLSHLAEVAAERTSPPARAAPATPPAGSERAPTTSGVDTAGAAEREQWSARLGEEAREERRGAALDLCVAARACSAASRRERWLPSCHAGVVRGDAYDAKSQKKRRAAGITGGRRAEKDAA